MMGGTVVHYSLLLVILLAVSATIFVALVFKGDDKHIVSSKSTTRSMREATIKEEEDDDNDDYENNEFEDEFEEEFPLERCPYGYDFLKKDFPPFKRHRLLPANHHQNFSGALFNRALICLDTMDASDGQWVGFYECHGQGRNQMITFSQNGLIVTDGNLCLSIKNLVAEEVILKKCDPNDDTQIWTTESYRGWVMPIVKTHFCLTSPEKELDPVTLSLCKGNSEPQRWQHSLQEVLALWISGTHRRRLSSRELEEGRAKVNKVLLHSQNSLEVENLFG